MKNRKGFKILLSVASVGFMFLGIYQFAFASTFGGATLFNSDRSSIQTSSISNRESTPLAVSSTSVTEKSFTTDELAKFNGINGNPAYVAVDGIVYDMTLIGSWKNGQHQGLSAGKDLSVAFANSPHSKAILDKSPIVGKLSDVTSATKAVDSVSTATVATGTSNNSSTSNNTGTTSQNTQKTIDIVSLPKTWTLDAVSKFNGIGGNPAYIVVSGKIYDVTSIGAWDGGVHKGIRAGQDVTTFFASSPHSASLLSQLPVVGNLGDSIASSVKAPVVTDATSSASLSNSSDDDYYDDEIEDHDGEDDEDEDENDHDEDDSHENEDDDDSHDD